MLSRARRGACEIVAGAALWRCRCEIVAGAALWRCRCRSRGRRSILCIWVCVCVAGVAFGSCLEGQDVVARAAGGVRNRGRRSTLAMPLRNRGRRSTLAMPLPKSWQAQHSVHLGVCLCGRGRIRQLSRGTGCCRARGGGCAKSWQAQHFGDAVAKSWQAQHFADAVAEVVAGAAFCASGCVFVWQGSHSARRGVCEIVAGAALWRCRCEIVAGAALWRCRCRSRGRRSILCIWVCVCVAGVAFGAAGGVRTRGRRSTLAMPLRNCGRRSTLAMPLPKSRQAQHSVHLGVCLCGRGRIRQLSRGTGCCRARGGGCANSWQAQHFGDAVAKSWQAQHFCDAVAEVVAGAAFCASGCSVIASIQGAHGTCVWTFGKNIACGVIRSFNFHKPPAPMQDQGVLTGHSEKSLKQAWVSLPVSCSGPVSSLRPSKRSPTVPSQTLFSIDVSYPH